MPKLETVDVLVVGAGLGGAAFRARLSERAPRLRIAALERGGWVDRDRMPALRRDSQRAALGSWATDSRRCCSRSWRSTTTPTP